MTNNLTTQSVSIDQLIALCEEIAALVRAGVPLENGLAAIGQELPGRVGRMAQSLDARLNRGEDLATALRATPEQYPEFFIAVVEAGVRSGSLALALQGLATVGRRMNEVRKTIALALLYPAILFFVAYGLLLFVVGHVAEEIGRFGDSMALERTWPTEAVLAFTRLPWFVHVAIPALGALVIGLALWWSARGHRMQPERTHWALSWLPSAHRLVTASQYATFTDLLALLFQQQVPVAEAVRLAARSSGGREVAQAGEDAARRLERGESNLTSTGIPPRIGWLLSASVSTPTANPETLVRSLRRLAESYREDALFQADVLRIYIPMIATVVIGGGIAVALAVAVLVPWYHVLFEMTQNMSRIL